MKKQMQYLFVGYPFAGKTVLAKELEKRFGFTRLSIDEIKFEFGFQGISDADIPEDVWQKLFEELDLRVVSALKQNQTVLNEYAWLTRKWRDRARKLARDLGIETRIIFVDAPENVVRNLLKANRKEIKRFDVPDDVFEYAIRYFEPPATDENMIIYSHADNLDDWIRRNF